MGVLKLSEKHYTLDITEGEIWMGYFNFVRAHIRNDKFIASARHTAHPLIKKYVRRSERNRILENCGFITGKKEGLPTTTKKPSCWDAEERKTNAEAMPHKRKAAARNVGTNGSRDTKKVQRQFSVDTGFGRHAKASIQLRLVETGPNGSYLILNRQFPLAVLSLLL